MGLYLAVSFAEHEEHDHKVVIVVSFGRSGSTWLCQMISGFDKKNGGVIRKELFGSNLKQVQSLVNPVEEMEKYLIEERKEHPTGFIGFKWKPLKFDSDKYIVVRKLIAERRYKVVMMHRNVLDEYLSGHKHSQANESLPAHCRAGEESCIQKHKSVRLDINVKNLLSSMNEQTEAVSSVRQSLRASGVHYLEVSYDELAWGVMDHRLKILQKIMDYLYPDSKLLATESIFEDSRLVSTQERNHSVLIRNYAEVQEALKETAFEKLLHET